MSANDGNNSPSTDVSQIDRPSDDWMNALNLLLARHSHVTPGRYRWRADKLCRAFRDKGLFAYGYWLSPHAHFHGDGPGKRTPPFDQLPRFEIAALKVILENLEYDFLDPANSTSSAAEEPVSPEHLKELRDLEEKATREVRKRLRELERDDGQPTASDDFTRANATRLAGGTPDWDELLMSPPLPLTKIAEMLGQPFELVDRMLRYQKDKNPCCCVENEDRRKGESRYLYRIEDVLPAIKKWLTKRAKKEPNPKA